MGTDISNAHMIVIRAQAAEAEWEWLATFRDQAMAEEYAALLVASYQAEASAPAAEFEVRPING